MARTRVRAQRLVRDESIGNAQYAGMLASWQIGKLGNWGIGKLGIGILVSYQTRKGNYSAHL